MQENPNESGAVTEIAPEQPVEAAPAAQQAVEEHISPAQHTPEPQPVVQEEAPRPRREKRLPDLSVMKVRSFMGALFLLMIPIVNLIMIFKWSFSRDINRNKRNLGLAALFLLLLFIALFVGACVLAQSQFGFDLPGYIWSFITGKAFVS